MKKNCEDYKDLLSAFPDNELSPSEVELLEGHLKVCFDCQEELNELESLKVLFHHYINSKPYPKVSPHFAANIIDSLRLGAKSNKQPITERLSLLNWVKVWLRRPQPAGWIAVTSILGFLLLFTVLLFSALRDDSRAKLVYELKSPGENSVSINNKKNLQYYIEEHAIKAAEYPIAGNKGLVEYIKNTKK